MFNVVGEMKEIGLIKYFRKNSHITLESSAKRNELVEEMVMD